MMKQNASKKLYGPVALEFTANHTGAWRLERPEVDYKNCVKCGTCQRYCPADIVTIDKNSEECVKMDWNYCKGCGICANECPKKCISMVPERSDRV